MEIAPVSVADAGVLADALLRAALAGTTRAEQRRASRLGRLLGFVFDGKVIFTIYTVALRDDVPISATRRSIAARGSLLFFSGKARFSATVIVS